MASFKYNPETNEYDYVEDSEGAVAVEEQAPVEEETTPYRYGDKIEYMSTEGQAALAQEAKTKADISERGEAYKEADERPLLAPTPGAFARDLGRSIWNPLEALASDYVDLGHGLVDVAGQTGSLISGNGFDTSKIFDDSDNPWTANRIERMRSESQAGQFVNTTLRVVAALATLPKVAIKWGVVAPLKLLSAAPAVGGLAKTGAKALSQAPKAYAGTQGITKGLANATKIQGVAGNATRLAGADDWLKLTYKEVVNAGTAAEPFAFGMRTAERAARSITKGKSKVRTVGEALAWDAFVAFNTAGEGNPMLDETMTDFFEEVGLPTIPLFRTTMTDTGLEAKFKQMGEGLILGGIVSSLMDVARIARFTKAFKAADPAEQKVLIAAFNDEAGDLGASLAKLEEAAESARQGPAMAPMQGPNAMQGPRQQMRLPPGSKDNYELLDEQLYKVREVRAQNDAAYDAQARDWEGLQGQLLKGINEQGNDPPSELLNQFGSPMRPAEPTVTPATLREGYTRYAIGRFEKLGSMSEELVAKTVELMPRNRVDAVDYLTSFPLRYNGAGTMAAADEVASSYLVSRGLSEGWMGVDENFTLTYNRAKAFEFDRNQYQVKAARAADEAAELERYDASLARMDGGVEGPAQKVPDGPATGTTQRVGPDEVAVNPASADDAALIDAKRQEQLARTEEAGAIAAEEQQSAINVAAYTDIGSDRQVVAEMLNMDLDSLPQYQIEKVGNRQYQILDETGASIDGRNYSTLKAARKGNEIARKEQLQQIVAKAREASARGADQKIQTSFGTAVRDSDQVMGTVRLTKRQLEVLNDLGVPLEKLDLELSQKQLAGMEQSLKQLLEGSTGSQRRVLKNILDRLDTAVTEMMPAARMAMEVDKAATNAQKLINNGEICF